jgi:pimeloyl-ACP methyl ester carboxylesterase
MAERVRARGADVQPALVGQGELVAARAIALVLHGGQEKSVAPGAARHVAVLRMVPIASRLAAAGASAGVAVWRLRFRYRGWNTDAAHPLADVHWAIQQLRQRHGDVPIVLVGHSMGGRAALRAADEPGVVGVLGLAPWVPPGEPAEQLAGRRLLVVHGTQDRITSARASRALVDTARGEATEATFISLRHTGHAMLRRAALWHDLTADFVMHAGLGVAPGARLADAIATGGGVL